MANPRLRGRVKFFLASRKVVFVTFMKDVGTITIKRGGEVILDGESRALGRTVVRQVPLGANSKFSILIVGARYADAKGVFTDTPELPRGVITAQLRTIVTNDPPGPPPPVDHDVDETEQDPQDEPGDDPLLADEGILFNAG